MVEAKAITVTEKLADRLTISIAGKPALKEAIEKAYAEYADGKLSPMSIQEFCAGLMETALTK